MPSSEGRPRHGLFDDFPMPSFPSVPSWAGLPSFEDLQRHLLGEAQDPGAAEFSPGHCADEVSKSRSALPWTRIEKT